MRSSIEPLPHPPQTIPLLGVVLSGGESRRMGRDKGLVQTGGKPWVLLMGDKLARHHLSVVYSINKRQLIDYSALLPADRLVIDTDERQGPLNGLFSVHQKYPDRDLLLVACDMQDLDEATIHGLLMAYRAGGADFYVYEAEGFLQPFCGIYTARALTRAGTETSLQGLLRTGVLRRLQGKPAAFRNYNTL
jgi:molybdenum cofactor guanylyltransferase